MSRTDRSAPPAICLVSCPSVFVTDVAEWVRQVEPPGPGVWHFGRLLRGRDTSSLWQKSGLDSTDRTARPTLHGMAMGKRPGARQASPMWVNTEDLPTSDGHPFFARLNRILEESGFDAFVEGLCEAFYACRLGRPSLRPGRYFRLLFIGYFEGVSSERGIAWRVADSLSLRSFLGPGRDGRGRRTTRRCRGRGGGSTWRRTRRYSRGCWSGWPRRVWCEGRRSASMRRRWKRTRRCVASSVGTRENRTRRLCGGWRRPRG